ncbi:MAG: hypothetical protein ACXVBJ_03005 [Flavisolibacter sp.]
MPGGEIYYKRRHEVEIDKWDRCISGSSNGLIYAYSYYLDATADNWDALVLNDYQAVMPLTWRKKFGVFYLYQPSFAAQLGVFGNDITPGLFESFLKAIPSRFRLWELSFNHQNRFELRNFPLFDRNNYVLPLVEPYEVLRKNYRENTRRNIKKSLDFGCYPRPEVPIDQIIELSKKQPNAPPEKEIDKFKPLFVLLRERSGAKSYGVFSKKEELLASCVFTFSHNRAYYILVGNHPNGRTLGASHALIDAFIRDHAEQNLLLDFEGSDIRNLAFFYSSFGAREERYSSIQINRLPWYIKWIKD